MHCSSSIKNTSDRFFIYQFKLSWHSSRVGRRLNLCNSGGSSAMNFNILCIFLIKISANFICSPWLLAHSHRHTHTHIPFRVCTSQVKSSKTKSTKKKKKHTSPWTIGSHVECRHAYIVHTYRIKFVIIHSSSFALTLVLHIQRRTLLYIHTYFFFYLADSLFSLFIFFSYFSNSRFTFFFFFY